MENKRDTWFASAERSSPEMVLSMYRELSEEMHFSEMLEAFPAPAAVINHNRQIVACNRRFVEAVPQGSEDALLGLRVGESIGCVNASGAPGGCGTGEGCRLCGAVLAMLEAQNNTPSVQECRITIKGDGQVNVPLDFRVLAVPLHVREHAFSVISFVDISDEKRRKVLERMFFHDVLNTASGVKSVAELYHLVEDTERDELIADLENISAQLIEEITAHRDLLSAEQNEMKAILEPTKPADVLRHVEALYRYHVLAQGKTIKVEIEDGLPLFDTNPAILARVLGNLLKNALEASKDGDEITLSCTHVDGTVIFAVRNPGVMPVDVKLQVFQRSFSTKGRDRGVGTYSARLLTQRMLGGSIGFESGEGSGTVFHVALKAMV